MAALDFPSAPTTNQIYSTSKGSWIWTGVYWKRFAAGTAEQVNTIYPTVGTNSVSALYQPSGVAVFRNGARQVEGVDFTATNGTSVVFTDAFVIDEVVTVVSRGVISTTDALLKLQNGADIPDKAVFRSNIGQRWRMLEDITVSGANAANIDMNLQGCRSLRLRYECFLPASVPSTGLGIRTSTDGTTFAAGSTDYYSGWDYSLGTSPTGYTGAGDAAVISPTWQAGQSTEIVIMGEFSIFAGMAGKRFTTNGISHGINSDSFIAQIGSRRQAAGQQSHLRIRLHDGSANIGIGSRFILEGA